MKKGIGIGLMLGLLVGLTGGITLGSLWLYEDSREHALRQVHAELSAAIRDGIPCYLKGSFIRIVPRQDGAVNASTVTIAGSAGSGRVVE